MKKFLIIIIMLFADEALAINSCTSIKPIHSIVENVTLGVSKDTLILDKKNANLHAYSLTPSDVLKIKNCDFIFIISNEFEQLASKLKNIKSEHSQIIELADDKNLKLLKMRENNIFAEDDNDHHDHHDHHHGFYDYHLWLNPDNVKIMASNIANILINADPANKFHYIYNLNKFHNKLTQLDLDLTKSFVLTKYIPYLVFHDAYQYFEHRYQLNSLGAILIDTTHAINARSLVEIKNLVQNHNVKCIFQEPQFNSDIANKIASSTKVKIAVLDPEWGDGQGEDSYFNLMYDLAKNINNCLN